MRRRIRFLKEDMRWFQWSEWWNKFKYHIISEYTVICRRNQIIHHRPRAKINLCLMKGETDCIRSSLPRLCRMLEYIEKIQCEPTHVGASSNPQSERENDRHSMSSLPVE